MHQNCQKEVEQAIRLANSDADLEIDFIEFCDVLQHLGYTPALEKQKKNIS